MARFNIPAEIKQDVSKAGNSYLYLSLILDDKEDIETRVFLNKAEFKVLKDNYFKQTQGLKLSSQDKE